MVEVVNCIARLVIMGIIGQSSLAPEHVRLGFRFEVLCASEESTGWYTVIDKCSIVRTSIKLGSHERQIARGEVVLEQMLQLS